MDKVYAIYDAAIKQYEQPFHMRSNAEAVRGWMKIVNDPTTKFHAHPEDFTLFELGEYNPETGQYRNLDTPHSLGVALNFKKEQTAVRQIGEKH